MLTFAPQSQTNAGSDGIKTELLRRGAAARDHLASTKAAFSAHQTETAAAFSAHQRASAVAYNANVSARSPLTCDVTCDLLNRNASSNGTQLLLRASGAPSHASRLQGAATACSWNSVLRTFGYATASHTTTSSFSSTMTTTTTTTTTM